MKKMNLPEFSRAISAEPPHTYFFRSEEQDSILPDSPLIDIQADSLFVNIFDSSVTIGLKGAAASFTRIEGAEFRRGAEGGEIILFRRPVFDASSVEKVRIKIL